MIIQTLIIIIILGVMIVTTHNITHDNFVTIIILITGGKTDGKSTVGVQISVETK